MGKKSRGKTEAQAARRSRPQLLEMLDEHRQFLGSSADSFDGGFEAEAKRMAVVLRVLLHDTAQSKSLLGQLHVKDRMTYTNTAEPIRPGNLAATPGLVVMRATMGNTGFTGKYRAPLGDGFSKPSLVPLSTWWNTPVMREADGHTWSRSGFVRSLANQEGGAHVDPSLNDRYENLARRNGLGWGVRNPDSSEHPFVNSPITASVRQISWELLDTLERHDELLQDED